MASCKIEWCEIHVIAPIEKFSPARHRPDRFDQEGDEDGMDGVDDVAASRKSLRSKSDPLARPIRYNKSSYGAANAA